MDVKEAVEFLKSIKHPIDNEKNYLESLAYNKSIDDVINLIKGKEEYIEKISKYKKYWDDDRNMFIH